MIKQADNRAVSVGSISPLHGNCGVQKPPFTGGFLLPQNYIFSTRRKAGIFAVFFDSRYNCFRQTDPGKSLNGCKKFFQ